MIIAQHPDGKPNGLKAAGYHIIRLWTFNDTQPLHIAKKGAVFLKRKGLWITLGVILLIIIIIVASVVSGYNGLVSAEEQVNTQKSNIQTQLQRRADLVPNLVATVKGYAAHEEEIFTAVADARAKLAGAAASGDVSEMDAANTELSTALSRLLVVVENYPDLKANQNFINLQDELAGTENRITVARKDYNEAAQTFNRKVRSFPGNIWAALFGFESVDYFEASDSAQQTPTVSFE